MNKELIKKYKAEFDHWLNGGKLQVKFVNDPWEEVPEGIFSYSAVNFVLVIEDEYVEFRKALAEGKNIQYKDREGFWNKIEYKLEEYHLEELRIKPEEPKFKVGDWVVNKTSKQRIIKKVTSVYSDTVTVGNSTVGINVMLIKDLELWQPQLGEWCWFWNKDRLHTVAQLVEVCNEGNRKYFASIPNKPHQLGGYYENCEPFLGQLPTSI